MFGKRDHLLRARSPNHYFIGDEDPAYRFMLGSVPHELCASLPGIVEYLESVYERAFGPGGTGDVDRLAAVFDLFARHEERVVGPLLAWLAERDGVRVIGCGAADRARRVPTVTFSVDGVHAEEVVRRVESHDRVAIRAGDFYAPRAIAAFGLEDRGGVVRASLVHYNTDEEVARLVAALDRAL
jgi:selenocysteine lyase/cysteine desulfurase